jgi:hypothetical protein
LAAEANEMGSAVQKQANTPWLGLAMDRPTPEEDHTTNGL